MTNGVLYTEIDLNTAAATAVFDPEHDATVHGVFMENPGSNANVELRVTDGTDTAIIGASGGGNAIDFRGPYPLDGDQTLELNVETAEGTSGTSTAVALIGE